MPNSLTRSSYTFIHSSKCKRIKKNKKQREKQNISKVNFAKIICKFSPIIYIILQVIL